MNYCCVSGHINLFRMTSMYACSDVHSYWGIFGLQEGVHVVGGQTKSLSDQLETIEA